MRAIRIGLVGIFFQRHRQKSEGVGKVFQSVPTKSEYHNPGSDHTKWNVPRQWQPVPPKICFELILHTHEPDTKRHFNT